MGCPEANSKTRIQVQVTYDDGAPWIRPERLWRSSVGKGQKPSEDDIPGEVSASASSPRICGIKPHLRVYTEAKPVHFISLQQVVLGLRAG